MKKALDTVLAFMVFLGVLVAFIGGISTIGGKTETMIGVALMIGGALLVAASMIIERRVIKPEAVPAGKRGTNLIVAGIILAGFSLLLGLADQGDKGQGAMVVACFGGGIIAIIAGIVTRLRAKN